MLKYISLLLICFIIGCIAKPPIEIPPKNPNDPTKLPSGVNKNVLIIGGGLAGLSAAIELADRGYSVTIKEKEERIGGKLFTIPFQILGYNFSVEHGFHAWFYNYYQFHNIRNRLNINGNFEKWEKVNYIFRNYEPEELYSEGPYPFNLLGIIARSPNLKLTDALLSTLSLPDMIYYDYETVWDKYDNITFEQWATEKKVAKDFYDIVLAPALSITLNQRDIFSAAEMLTYMQIYFLTNSAADHRETCNKSFYKCVLRPWVEYLTKQNVKFIYNSEVQALKIDDSFKVTGTIDKSGEDKTTYDYVIMTTDVGSTQWIVNTSIIAYEKLLPKAAEILKEINKTSIGLMKIAPHYKILRVWFDKQFNTTQPTILETPEHEPVNLVVQYHLLEDEYKQWAKKTGGSVFEFHCYTWTENFDPSVPDYQVWFKIAPTVKEIYPEIFDRDFQPLAYHVNSYQNFASFEKGLFHSRPSVDSMAKIGLGNMFLAGDWVKTPFPAALMERAVSTGRMAANEVLIRDHVRQANMTVVNLKGPGLF